MRAIVLLLAAALCCGSVRAAVPHAINYQGYLASPGGTPLNATVNMVFSLCNDPALSVSPPLLYTETQLGVPVVNGLFSVLNGPQQEAQFSLLAFAIPCWLGVKVASDPEMTPRQMFAASPYAIRPASTEALAATATVLAAQITGTVGAAASLTGVLAGDVTGTQGATSVGTVGGVTAANVAAGANLANAATSVNTALGSKALMNNSTGTNNIAIGSDAGSVLTTENNNIDIGNSGVPGESNAIRIGNPAVQTNTVLVGKVDLTSAGTATISATGHLGNAQFIGRGAAGSPGAETAVLNGTQLATFGAQGFNGVNFTPLRAAITMIASEIGRNNEGVHEVLEVAPGRFRTAFAADAEAVFVYGREVKDFRSVDYEAIAMLNVSATQELNRRLERQSAALAAQTAAMDAQSAVVHAQRARIALLEQQPADDRASSRRDSRRTAGHRTTGSSEAGESMGRRCRSLELPRG